VAGGAASAQGIAVAVTRAQSNTYATGGSGSTLGTASAYAGAVTTAANGSSNAYAQATGSAVTSQARADSAMTGSGQARAYGNGSTGSVEATSVSTGPLGRTVTAVASGDVAGVTQSITQSTFGGSFSGLPGLSGGSNGYVAFANVDGAPAAGTVTSILNAHNAVRNAIQADSLTTVGIGNLGANYGPATPGASHTYSASSEYTFTLASSSSILLGLLDFTGRSAGNPINLSFSASVGGTAVYSQSFSSLASAAAWFTDHPLNLGTYAAGNIVVDINLTLTSGSDQGAGFSYLLGTGNLTTPAVVPEPGRVAMLLPGLMVIGWMMRRRRAQQEGTLNGL
jgi:hypothetical protein